MTQRATQHDGCHVQEPCLLDRGCLLDVANVASKDTHMDDSGQALGGADELDMAMDAAAAQFQPGHGFHCSPQSAPVTHKNT